MQVSEIKFADFFDTLFRHHGGKSGKIAHYILEHKCDFLSGVGQRFDDDAACLLYAFGGDVFAESDGGAYALAAEKISRKIVRNTAARNCRTSDIRFFQTQILDDDYVAVGAYGAFYIGFKVDIRQISLRFFL